MTQRLIVLGAGTALPDRDRDNTFLVWESSGAGMLIDCGGRAYQQLLRADVDPKQLRGAVLTHNHPDHIYGLPAFLFHLWLAGYDRTFEVYANKVTLTMAQRLCDALELAQDGYMCATSWHELPEVLDYPVIQTEAYSIFTTPVQHSRPTLGVKIVDHQQQQTILYSSDTEPHATMQSFAQNVHTLIHEASVSDPVVNYGHTTPRQAGEIAAACRAKRVVLIHYSAEYTMPEVQAIAEVKAGGFDGEVVLAREFDAYTV
jgi:ribonuclease Z